ncbi:hypothetical protein ACWF99_00605 [Nocardia sp. NPDC055002]
MATFVAPACRSAVKISAGENGGCFRAVARLLDGRAEVAAHEDVRMHLFAPGPISGSVRRESTRIPAPIPQFLTELTGTRESQRCGALKSIFNSGSWSDRRVRSSVEFEILPGELATETVTQHQLRHARLHPRW